MNVAAMAVTQTPLRNPRKLSGRRERGVGQAVQPAACQEQDKKDT
jgi:hypothetical protein